jgi:hypothetical protein
MEHACAPQLRKAGYIGQNVAHAAGEYEAARPDIAACQAEHIVRFGGSNSGSAFLANDDVVIA